MDPLAVSAEQALPSLELELKLELEIVLTTIVASSDVSAENF